MAVAKECLGRDGWKEMINLRAAEDLVAKESEPALRKKARQQIFALGDFAALSQHCLDIAGEPAGSIGGGSAWRESVLELQPHCQGNQRALAECL